MRLYALFASFAVALAAPAFSQVITFGQSDPAQGSLSTIQLLVWNRAGQPIDVDVSLAERAVFSGRLREGTVAASMEAGRVLQREPGSYTVRVIDRTRGLVDSVNVRIDSQGQNVGVHLTNDGIAFVLTQHDITRLTPPPSAPSPR